MDFLLNVPANASANAELLCALTFLLVDLLWVRGNMQRCMEWHQR
jgi:hypothetical protein